MKKLGLDIGGSSCKLVLLNEENKVVYREYRMHKNKVQQTVLSMLDAAVTAGALQNEETVHIGVCGSMSNRTGLPALYEMNETLSLVKGQELLCPEAGSMIALGAQKTWFFLLQAGKEAKIYKNNNCSAGTGSFFEEQATRIGVNLEDISDLIATAESAPMIAGRCSVFSKTDMIHKMQEGVPTADLLNGLCYALVRNFKANVLRGREIKKPVVLTGGVMKNAGVLHALTNLLSLSEEDYILNENADFYGAAGCVADSDFEMTLEDLKRTVEQETTVSVNSIYEPLYKFRNEKDVFGFEAKGFKPGKTYLGIDIGSTSINLVLIGEDDEMQYYCYTKNTGNPLAIVKAEIDKMKAQMPASCEIAGMAVTGSGREYIAKQIGAEITINEITAQTEGATLSHPETDTIFEIGGQDSKYMAVKNGKMDDFEMNKVCAAGTGAFLEEQIKKLGISMAEFLDYALKGEHPCELGSRCTVFIEGGIQKALSEERSMPDICAGIAYSIAENYLNRVVNQKAVGENIAIQGGIAYNEAVVCAFRAITGKEVHISDHFSVTGALGAAHLCRTGKFLKFNKDANRAMNKFVVDEGEASYLRKYKPEPGSKKKVVGVPRALFLHIAFPLFCSMFKALGYDVLISPLTDKEIVALSQEYTKEEVCYPIKLLNGHVAWLLDHGADYILMPRVYTVNINMKGARRNYGCMYFQTSSLLLEETFRLKERGVTLLQPELSLEFGMKYNLINILELATQLNRPRPLLMAAMARGIKDMGAHMKRLVELGNIALSDDEPTFVLITRPYNLYDPILNMGIQEELDKLGCRVIHLEHLDARHLLMLPEEFRDVCWPFAQHIMSGFRSIMGRENVYPIYITNHGCGPDAAIQHLVQKDMEGKEYLHLEVDEHASAVGIATRIEAFLYSLKGQKNNAIPEPFVEDKPNLPRIGIVPEVGPYTALIEQYARSEFGFTGTMKVAEGLQVHKPFNYAINSEYYTMQLLLEEMMNACEKEKMNEIYFPINEGAEMSNQYAHLIRDELRRRGYHVDMKAFYMEDLIKFKDADSVYLRIAEQDLLRCLPKEEQEAVKAAVASQKKAPAPGTKAYLKCLATAVNDRIKASGRRKIFVMGEPYCVIKDSVTEKNLAPFGENDYIFQPLSETMLMHAHDINEHERRIKKFDYKNWQAIHDMLVKATPDLDLFTDMKTLEQTAATKIPFMAGGYSRYRFAKPMLLHKEKTDGMIDLFSADENAAIILRLFAEGSESKVPVPVCRGALDFEHRLSEDDAVPFLHAIHSASLTSL